MQPAVYGLAGETLSAGERDFFRDADPAGYILFGRNCRSRTQLRALTDSLRALHGRCGLLILVADAEREDAGATQPMTVTEANLAQTAGGFHATTGVGRESVDPTAEIDLRSDALNTSVPPATRSRSRISDDVE